LVESIGNSTIYASHYFTPRPYKAYAHGNVFSNQRGRYEKFRAFVDQYLAKFGDPKLKDPRDVNDLIWWAPLPAGIRDDVEEPEAVNKVLNYERTTFSVLSQGSHSLA